MQFFAYHGSKKIFAEDALKSHDYRCPECHGRLRIKRGIHRRMHFFHLAPPVHCRQSQKNELHLTIQKKIMDELPQGETYLEKAFPSIRRIADLVWEPKKLIFEVQCSPITYQEAKARMRDYKSVGYRVIWVLHDKRFNRRHLSSAEAYLRPYHAYFTSINTKGEGLIYDQQEQCDQHIRTYKGPPLPIDLRDPTPKQKYLRRGVPPPRSKIKTAVAFFYYLLLKKLIH